MIDQTLLDELYAKIIFGDDLAEVHRLLCASFESHGGLVVAGDEGARRVIGGFGMSPETTARYNAHYHASDPYYAAIGEIPFASFAVGSDYIDPQPFARTEYYNEVHKPSDIWDMLGLRVGSVETEDVYYCLYKPAGRVFEARHRLLMADFVPHLQRAHRLRALARSRASTMKPQALRQYALTTTERRVLEKAVSGLTTLAAAEGLRMSISTLRWHLRNIYEKTGVNSRAALIAKFWPVRGEAER